jgi:hypothetical protein
MVTSLGLVIYTWRAIGYYLFLQYTLYCRNIIIWILHRLFINGDEREVLHHMVNKRIKISSRIK